MAQLSSFATTASNVSVDSNERRITISSEVVEIDGVLDPPTGFDDWGGWEIVCQSSGGFRSTSGASGTLGGGVHSLKIVEKTNGHRFGANNWEGSNGANARFAGDGTNTLVYSNIVWIVETGNRSDFDIGRGTANNGSQGPKVVLTGVTLLQLTQAGTQPNHNHYSGQATIREHDSVGYGLKITNRTTGHVWEFSTPVHTGAVVEGLVIDNISNPTNHAAASNARAIVNLREIPSGGEIVIRNLNTPSITDNNQNGDTSKKIVLIDPVGQPTITTNWDRWGLLEIRRTVPFSFPNAQPSGETMHAINQNSGGQNATAAMTGATGSVVVRTQLTDSSTTTNWTDYHDYRFFMTGLGFRKYALNTNTEITNTPSTITANLTPDVLPDGTAISTIAQTNAQDLPDTLPKLLRHIKDHEVDNPVHSAYPTTSSLAYVDGNSVKINDAYRVVMNSSSTTPLWNIGQVSGNDTIQFRTDPTISAGNGLTTLDASGTSETITATNVAEGDGVFFKDSTGQRSVISVSNNMGGAVLFSLVKASDATTAGSATIASAATGSFSVGTKGLGSGYKLVGKRPGYNYFSTDVDLTGGGQRTITASAQTQIVQPDGSASYVTSVSVPDTLTIAVSHSGTTPASRVECGNDTFTARQVFKAWEDEIASADGASYMGLGGAQVTYTLSALKGNEIVLGAHTKVKRKASTDVNATIRATLYAPDDAPVDGANGDVQTIEGLDIPAVATEIWKTDLSGTQADNSAGDLLKDASTNSGGGGGSVDIDPDDIWGYREVIATYTPSGISDGDLVFSSGDMDNFTTGNSVRVVNNGGYTGATNGQDFYVRHAGAAIQLFNDRATAIAGTQNARVRLTGAGTIGNVRVATLTTTAIDRVNSIPDDVWTRTGGRTITGGGATAQQIWEYSARTLTSDAPPSASDVADAVWSEDTRTLTSNAAPSASDVADAVWSETTRTLTSDAAPSAASVATAVWGADTRTLTTSAAPSASSIATAVWDTSAGLSVPLTPVSVGGGYLRVDAASDALLRASSSKIVRFTRIGGLGGVQANTDYVAREFINRFWNIDTTDGTRITVTGDIIGTGMVLDGGSVLGRIGELGTAQEVADAVWDATDKTITGGAPSADEIAREVWTRVIGSDRVNDLTLTPSSISGGFLFAGTDALLLANIPNGESFTLTGVSDDVTGINNTDHYYAGIAGNKITVYRSRLNALQETNAVSFNGPGDDLLAIRVVFPAKAPLVGAGEAIRDLYETNAGLESLISANFVESGLSLQQAIQILTAIAAGRLSIGSNGTTYTYHRLDSGETAAIRSETGETGRGSPTRDPS